MSYLTDLVVSQPTARKLKQAGFCFQNVFAEYRFNPEDGIGYIAERTLPRRKGWISTAAAPMTDEILEVLGYDTFVYHLADREFQAHKGDQVGPIRENRQEAAAELLLKIGKSLDKASM